MHSWNRIFHSFGQDGLAFRSWEPVDMFDSAGVKHGLDDQLGEKLHLKSVR